MTLVARKLGKRYGGPEGIEAVRGVSFEVEAGRFLALVGRSGSGKSTLLGMIAGLLRPTAGAVEVEGVDPWSLGENERAVFRGRRVGFVFQMPSLLPTLRAIDNVALPALVGKTLGAREAYARAEELLRRVGLGPRTGAYPGELSGGEQRRVALARSLVSSPPLLLADEPTGDLDEETESEILELLDDLRRSENVALVVATHSAAAARRADRVLSIRRGAVGAIEAPPPRPAEETVHLRSSPLPVREASAPAAEAAPVAPRLGAGLARFATRFAIAAAVVGSTVAAADWAVERHQRRVLERRWREVRALEELAMAGLRADVDGIAPGEHDGYRLVLYLRNATPDETIYATRPEARAYVQVGTSWREVPLRPAEPEAPRVARIEGKRLYPFDLDPDVPDFEPVLPHYMHVRITNTMLVSRRSEPRRDELVERTDSYYVHLKPRGADDAAILRDLRFPGTPPLWIPMPPH